MLERDGSLLDLLLLRELGGGRFGGGRRGRGGRTIRRSNLVRLSHRVLRGLLCSPTRRFVRDRDVLLQVGVT